MNMKLKGKIKVIIFMILCVVMLFGSKTAAETVKSKVNFVLSGGYFTNDFITEYEEGKVTKLPTNVLKPGYTFDGWYEQENFADEKQTSIPSTKTGEITYYAKWKLAPTKNGYVKVSGGMYHTLAIDVHGNLIGWGINNNGQLADQTVLDKLTPTIIKEGTKFKNISAGGLFSLALDEEEKLWATGSNGVGQLGDGTNINKSSLVQITNSDNTKFTKISAGLTHSLAIDENGTLWAWGHNSKGELGNGTTTNSNTPIKIMEGTKFIEISAGNESSFAIDETGKLYAWGSNENGKLALGNEENKLVPTLVESDIVFKKVETSTGENYTLALDELGNLYTWGINTYGQLGNGSFESKNVPTKIQEGKTFKEIDVGYNTSFAIDEQNNLWSFGANGNGELGDGSQTLTNIPKQVLTNVISIGASWNHTVSITQDGSVNAWGSNENGELGTGNVNNSLVPIVIAKKETVNYNIQHYKQKLTLNGYDLIETETKEGAKNSYAVAEHKEYEGFIFKSATSGRIREDGSTILKVYYDRKRENVTFETNGGFINGEKITDYVVGVETNLPTNVVKIGYNFAGWYENENLEGEPVTKILSDSTNAKTFYAKWIANPDKAVYNKITGGMYHFLALDKEGSLFAWGLNHNGQCGNGNTQNLLRPTQIMIGTTFKEIAAGTSNSLAIDKDGNLYIWGENGIGQLGNEEIELSTIPVKIMEGTKFTKVAAGGNHYLAIDELGKLYTWGENSKGQLGNGTSNNVTTPSIIMSDKTFKSISAGFESSVAITTDGKLYVWGANEEGNLGDGSRENKNTPINIQAEVNFESVEHSTGLNYFLAIDENGNIWGVGDNSQGQLGDGTLENKTELTQITTDIVFTKVATGYNHTLALDENGNLYVCGSNLNGQLGDETGERKTRITKVFANVKFEDIDATWSSNIAIRENNTLYVWGENNYGQLGDGTTNSTYIPEQTTIVDKTYEFEIELDLGDGSIEGEYDKQYEYGKEYILPIPTKPGYVFKGWYDNAEFKGEPITSITIGESGNKHYYAKWEPREDVTYKVNHYKQNDTLDGYDLEEIEELQGTMDTIVNAIAKQYDGYIVDINRTASVVSGTIVADGSLVLKLYYNKLFEQSFNINITNVDGYSDEAIANSKYDVVVEYMDGTTKEYLGNIADENGNIHIANVSGKNTMKVYIKQVEGAEGYTQYDTERFVEVKVNSENKIELTGAKTPGIEANVEENTLNIKYLNYTEDFSNTIRINTVDNIDNDIKVANVKFKVTFPDGTTQEHTTSEDGMIEFRNVEPPAMGTFVYQLDQIDTPYGYKTNTDKTYIAVTFNEVGTIIKVISFNLSSNKENNTNIVSEMDVNTQNTITNINIEQERLTGENSIFSDYDLKIVEKDIDTGAKVQDVKYKITQKVLNDGMTSTITANKVTNENGEIILEFTNGEEILLTIKRTKVPDGYKMLKEEIKIPLVKQADGKYALSNEVEGVTIDNESKTIIVDRNIYKIDSGNNKAKAKLNNTIYITKVDKYMRPLQGVTMQLREMTSGKTWDLTTDENGLAKITSKDLVEELGCEFPEYLVTQKGKLTFWITEKTVPMGYERINEDIGFEAYYEVDPTGKMQISYMNVLDGLSYYHIVNQEYSEYEEEEYIQVDIKLTVLNNYSSGVVDIDKDFKILKIEKRDYSDNRIKLGNAIFEVTFVYPVSGKVRVQRATKADGVLIIPNVYLPEGTTIVEIKELKAPYGYRRITNTMTVTIKNEGGVISVLDGGNVKDNEEIRIIIGDVKYGTSYGGGSGNGTIIGGGGSGGSGGSSIGGSGEPGGSGSGGIGGSWGAGGSGGSGGSGGIITGDGSGGSGPGGSGGSGSGSGSGGGSISGGASGTGGSGGITKPGSGGGSGSGGSGGPGGPGGGSGTITSPIRPGDSETSIFGIQIDKVNKYNEKIRVKDALYMITVLNEETNKQTVKFVNTNNTGRVLLSDLTGFGNFKITISEINAPESYSFDEQKHEIRIHRDQESHMITMLNDDTSENTTVIIDNINKIINMTIKESPKGIGLSILKQDYDDEEITLKNSKFEIIDNATNERYELVTGDEGAEYISLPTKEDGAHTFTIRELEAPQGYNKLVGDLTLTVNYVKGKIASANVSGTNAEITNQNAEYIEINVLNNKIAEGLKYDIELIKADAYYSSITFENAKIKIDVDNESGMQGITKTALTNKDGKIYINDMYGTGKVSIRITELVPPPGRRFDIKEKQVLLNIDSQTGWIKLNQGSSNVDVFIDNDAKKITIRVRNYPDGTFIIGANKVDSEDKDLILLGAKYNILLEETGDTFEVGSYEDVLLAAQNIPMPNVESTAVYTYKITEVQAPFGYALNETPIILKVEVSKEQGINVITNAYIESGNAEVEKYGDEFVHLLLKNTALNGTEGSEEGEGYNINVIKVDSEDKNYRVAGTLIGVHVQAESGENYYKELLTDENGQISLNHIKGTGKVTVTLKELNNSPNYLIANGIKTIEFTRDRETKEIIMGTIIGDKVTASITEANNVTIVFENTLDSTVATIIKPEKVWIDTTKQKVHRPENIKIQIKNGDTVVAEKEILSTELGTIFTNLPKYDSEGNEITYSIEETEVNEGDLKFYVSSIEGSTITNTFTLPDDIKNATTSITAIKHWVDTEEQKVHRPANIKVQIKNGETVVEEKEISNTTENVTFENLPKYDENGNEIIYIVEEIEVNEEDLKFYVSSIEGNIITNTFTLPDDIKNATTSITATKHWVDTEEQKVHRPANIKVQIKNGETVVAEKEISNTTENVTFEDLPKYDEAGNEINYTIVEAEVNEDDLEFYVSSIEGNIITNTFTVPTGTIQIEVNKVWVDTEEQKVHRPANIKVQIKNGETVVAEKEISNTTENITFEDLPKYDEDGNKINYSIIEAEVNEGDLKFYESSIEGNTITNTFTVPSETINIEVTKVWVDTEEQKVHRPENIKVQIKNGDTVVAEKEISNTTENVTFENLPKYDSNGNEIEYRIVEAEVNEGDLKFYESTINGNVITNTFTLPSETVEIEVTKQWVDNNNEAGKRPTSVIVVAKSENNTLGQVELTVANALNGNTNAWVGKIVNLPKYDSNGNIITYEIDEVEKNIGDLIFYQVNTNQETRTVTNTFIVPSETVEIEVNKVWVDTEEQKVHRPENIKVQIKNGDTVVAERIILNNETRTTFTLPKYDSNGNIIIYTIAEAEVNEGDLKFYVSSIEGNTITNTFTVPSETVEIEVSKVWVDTEEQKVHRPSNIKVQIKNGETVVEEKEISNTTEKVTFENLPKYDADGNEINYTIAEAEVNEGDLKFYVSSIEGNTITNTFTVPSETINIEVTKEWVDNNNEAVKRPTSIIIVAKSGNNVIGQVELTVANALNGNTNTWVGQIENLPKYDSNGNIIVYEIDEIEKNSGDLYFYAKNVNGNRIINTLQLEKAKYKVEHYRRTEDEEVEGYICEVEYFEEYPGKFVTAVPKDYEGFVENTSHPNRIPSGIVAADGSLVLKLYYNRERYNITYVLNGGTATGRLQNKYTYGEQVYLSKKVEKDGFEFGGWYDNEACIGQPVLEISPGETGDKVFYAKWRKEVISSDKYNIDGVEKYISKVSPETTVNSFIQNMQIDGNIKIYDSKGNEVAPNKFVGTGYKAVVEKDGETYEYEIAVRGDLDGNGKVTATDLSTLNQAIIKKIKLEGVKALAADIDGNEKITATDLSTLNQAVIKKIKL